MIALLLFQAAAAAGIDGTPLGTLPPQTLPVRGCAAYLWSAGTQNRLVAFAASDPAGLRLVIDGKLTDLAREGGDGPVSFGLAATTHYRAGDATAILTASVQTRADLAGGAAISATLRLDRPGRDGIVMPVGGLIACASESR
jgi:hypothetical protein